MMNSLQYPRITVLITKSLFSLEIASGINMAVFFRLRSGLTLVETSLGTAGPFLSSLVRPYYIALGHGLDVYT